MGVGGQHHGSAALLAGNPDTHSTDGWVGLATALVECRKSRPPSWGFEPRIGQPLPSRYTNCATPANQVHGN